MPSVEVAGTEFHHDREGSGEPMLLIQGMSATHLAWGEPFLASLRKSFDCVVFDNRGMGLSGRAEMPFTIADLAGDTVGLLDALEIERAHVVGISMGGMVAQELVLANPERIRTLTLGATYCGGPSGALMDPEDVKRLGAAMAANDPGQVRRVMWEINLSPTFREDDSRFAVFEQMAMALPSPGPVILQQMRACGAHNTSDRLAQISTPTLVIHGTEDHLLPVANGHEIAALIPTRLELLDGVGHMFWWEQPERAAELIRDHAGQPAGSSSPLTLKT
jgi:pimeloyl-ACP methyl ester carboxylesterase